MNRNGVLKAFCDHVLPVLTQKLKPERVLLFGSHAAGTASDESDIDIIIVSDAFRGVPFIRRMTMVLKMARFPRHIDYLCYTPEEFGRISRTSVILQDALTYAIELPGDQTKLIGTVK